MPARSRRAAASATSTLTIAESPRLEPETGAEPVCQRDVVTLDLGDADREQELERRRGGDPREPGRRRVEPPRRRRQGERCPVVGVVDVLAGEPAGVCRDEPVEQALRHRQVRGPARACTATCSRRTRPHRRAPRRAAASRTLGWRRSRRVSRARPLLPRSLEVGQLAGGGLHGAAGDDRRRGADRVGHLGERDGVDLEPVCEPRPEERREVAFRRQHAATRKRRRPRDRRARTPTRRRRRARPGHRPAVRIAAARGPSRRPTPPSSSGRGASRRVRPAAPASRARAAARSWPC